MVQLNPMKNHSLVAPKCLAPLGQSQLELNKEAIYQIESVNGEALLIDLQVGEPGDRRRQPGAT